MNRNRAIALASGIIASGLASFAFAGLQSGDVVVYQVGDGITTPSTNSTPLVLEDINPATSTSSVAVDASTQSSPLYTTNEGSLGDLSLFNDAGQTAVGFSGWTGTGTNLSSTNTPRGAGALTLDGTYSQAASYTLATAPLPTATDQVRSVTSLDGTNYYFADKTGFYYSGGNNAAAVPLTPNTPVNNYRGIKSFGGTIYAVSQNNTPFISSVAVTPTTDSLGTLPGLTTADSHVQDFTMLQSGLNGTTFDTLFTLDTGSTHAAINKFFFNGTTWNPEGSLSLTIAGSELTGVNGLGAVALPGGGTEFYVTDNPTTGASFVAELDDSAADNASISVTSSQITTADEIYTAPTGAILDGVVAVPEPATISLLGMAVLPLLARRRRKA